MAIEISKQMAIGVVVLGLVGCVPEGHYTTCPYNPGNYTVYQQNSHTQQGWLGFNDQRICSQFQSK